MLLQRTRGLGAKIQLDGGGPGAAAESADVIAPIVAFPHHNRKFGDGFPNLFVKDATKIRNRHVAFLASFIRTADIFEQISIIYQLPRMFVGSFTLVLPYFPTGTAERVIPLAVTPHTPLSKA